MRWYPMIGVLVLIMLLATLGLPVASRAQDTAGWTDFRARSGYSAEDLAQALFPAAEPSTTPGVRTRGMGAPEAVPSLPVPRSTVVLNVLFAPNSETVPSSSHAELDKLGTVLSWPQHADYRIQLEGHTDNQGSDRLNQTLSERRVQNIKTYLVQHFRIAPERVRTVGYGESRPIASNETLEGRSQNRRVEVVNLGR